MSLIQDALKRQQEETESSRVPLKAATVPSVPDTMSVPPSPPATLGVALRAGPEPAPPPPPAPVDPPATLCAALRAGPEKPVQLGKSWKQIAGIVIFCVLIAWSGSLVVGLILKQSAVRTLLGPFMPDLTKAQATLGKSSVQAPPPAAQTPAMAMSKPVVTPSPVHASESRPLFSPAAAAAPAFADEGEDIAEDVALPGVKEQIKPGAVPGTATWPRRKIAAILGNAGTDQEGTRLKPVVWPRLKLSAVFSNVGSGQSGARLNNRLILLGDQIDGVTLVEILRDSVVLEYGQETRSLKMGATLN